MALAPGKARAWRGRREPCRTLSRGSQDEHELVRIRNTRRAAPATSLGGRTLSGPGFLDRKDH
jgi:hypothetical protein